MGAELASRLDTDGHQVVIIDTDASSFEKLPSDFKGTTLLGDATDEEVLRKAGIADADGFVAVTREDDKNAMTAQIAKEIFHIPRVLCRIYDPLREEFYKTLGLEGLSPTIIFAKLLKEKLEQ